MSSGGLPQLMRRGKGDRTRHRKCERSLNVDNRLKRFESGITAFTILGFLQKRRYVDETGAGEDRTKGSDLTKNMPL